MRIFFLPRVVFLFPAFTHFSLLCLYPAVNRADRLETIKQNGELWSTDLGCVSAESAVDKTPGLSEEMRCHYASTSTMMCSLFTLDLRLIVPPSPSSMSCSQGFGHGVRALCTKILLPTHLTLRTKLEVLNLEFMGSWFGLPKPYLITIPAR